MASPNTTSHGGLTADEINTIDWVSTVIQSLSLAGSLFIIACFWKFHHLRKFSFVLVAILSCCDAVNQVTDLLQPSAADLVEMRARGAPYSPLCYVQAVGQSFLELSSVLWTSAIAATLYITVLLRRQLDANACVLAQFAAVCFGLPLVLTAIAGGIGALGPSGAWCYIVEEYQYWRFVGLYGPLWCCVIFNTFVYLRVYWLLNTTLKSKTAASDGVAASVRAIMKRLQFYPFILVVVWSFATVNRIWEAAGGRQVFALYLLQRAFSSTQGLLNALAYGLSPGVREAIRELLVPYCKCCAAAPAPGSAAVLLGSQGGARGKVVSPLVSDVSVHNPFAAAGGGKLRGEGGQPSAAGSPNTKRTRNFDGSATAPTSHRVTPPTAAGAEATTLIQQVPGRGVVEWVSHQLWGSGPISPPRGISLQAIAVPQRVSSSDARGAADAMRGASGGDVTEEETDDELDSVASPAPVYAGASSYAPVGSLGRGGLLGRDPPASLAIARGGEASSFAAGGAMAASLPGLAAGTSYLARPGDDDRATSDAALWQHEQMEDGGLGWSERLEPRASLDRQFSGSLATGFHFT